VISVCAVVIFLRGDIASELSAKEADLNTRVLTIDRNIKNAKHLKEDVDEVQDYLDQINDRLFNRDQRAVNINFFYAMEDQLDVRISDISQKSDEDKIYAKGGTRELKLYSTISYEISVDGQFGDILEFLYELHRVDSFIRVVSVQLGEAGRSGSLAGALQARLRLVVLAEKN
jgi:hypothetical protein